MPEPRGPIVHIATLGRRAHLLAWHRHGDTWWAHVHWLTFTPDGFGRSETFADNDLCVHADEIKPVTGWDYSGVPRIQAHPVAS